MTIKKSLAAIQRSVSGNEFLLNLLTDRTFLLNEVSLYIWSNLGECSTEEIAANLSKMYNEKTEIIQNDVDEVINILQEEGLIEILN